MQPLNQKTVFITRSADQTADFIIQLQNLGAQTISLPLIKNTLINEQELKRTFNSKKYDWLIYTSTNAVKFFFECIDLNNINSKIAVVGEKTKKAIENMGLRVDFTPTQFTAKMLAKELPITENDSILIPRSDLAKNDIVEILESRDCNVKTLSIYKNSSIHYTKTELNNIFNQKIDYITFTSGSTVKSFIELGFRPINEKIICIGPETAKIAKENNLVVSAIANPHTTEGMIEAIKSLT
jgi:uroporphyrinogen-III synthase